jgi:chromosome segregation ATPase
MSHLRDKIEKLLKTYEYRGQRGGLIDLFSDGDDIGPGVSTIETLADAIADEVGTDNERATGLEEWVENLRLSLDAANQRADKAEDELKEAREKYNNLENMVRLSFGSDDALRALYTTLNPGVIAAKEEE